MQVYRDAAGNLAISRDDHRHFCDGLIRIAQGFPGQAGKLMRYALESGAPLDRDGMEAVKYFGKELPLIVKLLEPLNEALEGMLPGYKVWMPLTLFGNDKDFILALLAISRALAESPKLTGKAKRSALAPVMPKLPAGHVLNGKDLSQ